MAEQQKKPKKITPKRLYNIAVYYLQRYESSVESLRRVLIRRIDKSALVHEIDKDEAVEWAEDVIKKMMQFDFVNDERYSENQIRSMFQKGTSIYKMKAKLKSKGVPDETIETALSLFVSVTDNVDMRVAVKYAKRRRFGAFRQSKEVRKEKRNKDMAAMSRAGFDFGSSKTVIDAETLEELEEFLT
ncbi:MAG: RecX family transcriptional regulator [Alphaproteobacteria bacterium]|nr:RecX family transcriptional regulator [Alphaproteobacteria bacterium]